MILCKEAALRINKIHWAASYLMYREFRRTILHDLCLTKSLLLFYGLPCGSSPQP